MKHIKEYNEFDIDPFNEDDWDELEIGSFLTWLKHDYPDESKWKDIKSIYGSNSNLTDLIGIEKLINLTYLHCHNNELKELDISKNINLIGLYCGSNQLRKLDLSNNIKLIDLYCGYNQLRKLDVSNNIKLIDLYCHHNQLKE